MFHLIELLEMAITYFYALSADKSGRTHNPYDDFAKQYYRRKGNGDMLLLTNFTLRIYKNSAIWENFLTYLTYYFYLGL